MDVVPLAFSPKPPLPSLLDAVLAAQGRDREEQPGTDEGATCAVCGKGPLRIDNATRVCRECQRAHLGPALCACGCGQHVDRRAQLGYRRACFARVLFRLSSEGRQ
jgi:hypothetical protein